MAKKKKQTTNVSWALSQATALEIYDGRVTTGATQNYNQLPENDSSAACTLMLKNC